MSANGLGHFRQETRNTSSATWCDVNSKLKNAVLHHALAKMP